MQTRFCFLILLSLVVIIPSFSQVKDSGKVVINADGRVALMQQKYIDSQNGKIKGYRVQIHFGNEKNKAKEIKSKFLTKHNNMRAYDSFESPYFKVRVGDFRTKLEAYKFMKEIADEFPGAFIVTDNIDLPEI